MGLSFAGSFGMLNDAKLCPHSPSCPARCGIRKPGDVALGSFRESSQAEKRLPPRLFRPVRGQ